MGYYYVKRNILISPIVICLRMPIMLLGMSLFWLGDKLQDLGEMIPGWHRG